MKIAIGMALGIALSLSATLVTFAVLGISIVVMACLLRVHRRNKRSVEEIQ